MTLPTGADIAARLRAGAAASPITYMSEDELQEALAAVLGDSAVREVRLSDGRSRIDILMHGVGVEVKVAGSLADVIRQLDRYAACEEIRELVLVTTRSKHHHIPALIGARRIPLHLVTLIENGL